LEDNFYEERYWSALHGWDISPSPEKYNNKLTGGNILRLGKEKRSLIIFSFNKLV
jgi:hypothetical protein